MSLYWKVRTKISGKYRDIERKLRERRNVRVISKYKGKKDIYCVIRLHSDEGGLFCLWFKALQGIKISIDNGFIPVIDMQTKENIFTTKKQRKQINIWEAFFEQPVKNINYSEIKNFPNRIVIENPTGLLDFDYLVDNSEERAKWRKIVIENFKFSKKVTEEIEKYKRKFENSRVLGVLARGTDYLNPNLGHYSRLNIPEIIKCTEERMTKFNCNKLFLATEDSDILDAMKDRFGDKLIFVEQKRYRGQQSDKLGHLKDYVNDAVAMNISYLSAMYFLSRCDYFWGSRTTGSMGVYLLKENDFKSFELWKRQT